jgi:agmatine deiminase
MRKFFPFFFITLLNCLIFNIHGQEPLKKLTHWLSPEEKLHWNDIGINFVETDPPQSPVRNVAEFDKMQGVLVAYPFGIPITLIQEMATDVIVTTIVANTTEQNMVTQQYQAAGVNLSHCNFLIAPSDSYWTRDYGPWFESDSLNHMGIVDFEYNRPRPNDDNIPVSLATMLGIPWYGMKLAHTGGNYMTDGLGISSSTTLVWDENDTTIISVAEIAQKMHDYLGINNYKVIPDPNGTYIDHIDCWGKFLAPDRILIRKVPSTHPQYSAIEATAAYYASQICSYGYTYRVFRVNTPDDQPYTNSLILNNKVLVPIMNSTWDDSALAAYRNALPGYQVIGFTGYAPEPWVSTDALHCRTMGIADLGQLYIKHIPLFGNQSAQDNFLIQADLIRCSDSAAWSDSVLVWYKVNNGEFSMIHMVNVSGDHYQGYIPKQTAGSVIRYYLYAADKSERHATAPFIGPADPFMFTAAYTDLTAIPDTLKFATEQDVLEGKITYIHNYTSTGINLNSIEEMGFFTNGGGTTGWRLDPVPVSSYPYMMNPGDSLQCRVIILVPVDKSLDGYAIDTMNYISAMGTHKVILLLNDSLFTSLRKNKQLSEQITLTNYPNPFAGLTSISFSMNHQSTVKLDVLDLDGRKVKTLAEGIYPEGISTVSWDGSNESGIQLSAGIYLYRITTKNKVLTKRMMLVK